MAAECHGRPYCVDDRYEHPRRWLQDRSASAKHGPESWYESLHDLRCGKDTPAVRTLAGSIAVGDRPFGPRAVQDRAASRRLAGAPTHFEERQICEEDFSISRAIPGGQKVS